LLGLLNDAAAGPVFVHCRRGADRTGTVLACYRIAHDGWDNSKALSEARSLGMSWIERAMQSYVLHYAAAPAPAKPIATAVAADQ
jgi:protein-tyrosine phosphatase